NEIARKKKDAESRKKTQKLQWKTGGAIDEDILRDESQHSVEGLRKATVDRFRKDWMATARRVFGETGDKGKASEIADMQAKQDDWMQAQRRTAGMVNARSGVAEAAAIARWSAQGTVYGAGGNMEKILGGLHRDFNKFATNLTDIGTRQDPNQ
ncbi:MAG TPA: hypothetical protein VHY22_00100, partial [Chthoniobacteraceae bacterium]|nr:hypothetical protein [Chthoniobacteraceae bacterium]